MKLYIKSSSDARYLYIFKHGIGPGTIPSDVQIVKTKDLPNGYTAVWLDRFLTADELKQYDIPSETRINELLGRIDYCQKNGDVVPCDDIDACDKVTASDTKYFANMVSASIDDSDDDKFLVEGYYDNQRQGLAESAETSDISYLNELINEYANKGYYIAVHNLTDGTITEFSADNWFDDLARDGGAILFMS